MTPKKYKITLDHLRIAASKYRVSPINPCMTELEKLFIAMEHTNMDYMLMRKYVNELDTCMKANPKSKFLQEKKSTMFHLSRHLDQQKHKRK